MFCAGEERWASFVSFAGALLWALVAVLAGARRAPLGVIELLLLFAPLVVVPAGLELAQIVSPGRWPVVENTARMFQPLAAGSVIAAFWIGPGRTSGLLAVPWAALTGMVALSGVMGLRSSKTVAAFVSNLARLDLGIAGGWLLLSRLGARAIGIQEPVVLLTAVHFHYAGFGAALIAAAGAQFAQPRSGVERRPWQIVSLAAALLPFAVALGFILGPLLKVVAATLFAISIMVLAAMLWQQSARFLRRTARVFIRMACLFIIVGMGLAAAYAVGDYRDQSWLTVPAMASTHGWINGLGFVMPGLLGWLVELDRRSRPSADPEQQLQSRLALGELRAAPAPNFVSREFHDL